MRNLSLQEHIQNFAWEPILPDFWVSILERNFRVAILAPPLDTVPSKKGNAIYSLIETLGEKLPFETVVLANGSSPHKPYPCPISDRILYYHGQYQPRKIDKLLPYRVKKHLFGMAALHMRPYARSAAQVCNLLDVNLLIIEDIPGYVPLIDNQLQSNTKLILHQHINGPTGTPKFHWKNIQKHLDHIIFVAQQTADECMSVHGPMTVPYSVIYNGVDLEQYNPEGFQNKAKVIRKNQGIKDDDQVLLYVGRITPHKGILQAIQAFNQCNLPKVHFVIVGHLSISQFTTEDFLRIIKFEASKNPNVHLVGGVRQDIMPVYYAVADTVIVPTIGDEGLPKVITEALAMGKPVVTSQRGGSWELLTEGQNRWQISDPSNVDDMAGCIQNVFDHPELIKNYQKNVLNSDRPKMSEDFMIGSFTSLIQKVLEKTENNA